MRQFVRFFAFVCALLSLVACSKTPVLDVGLFAPYVSKFENLSTSFGAPVKVENLIIHYGQMQNPQERGACILDGDNTPTITIRQDTWEAMSEPEREELLFHEMGHCVLHRGHNPVLTQGGMPASIMNPYIIAGYIYVNNQTYYIKELFVPSTAAE